MCTWNVHIAFISDALKNACVKAIFFVPIAANQLEFAYNKNPYHIMFSSVYNTHKIDLSSNCLTLQEAVSYDTISAQSFQVTQHIGIVCKISVEIIQNCFKTILHELSFPIYVTIFVNIKI